MKKTPLVVAAVVIALVVAGALIFGGGSDDNKSKNSVTQPSQTTNNTTKTANNSTAQSTTKPNPDVGTNSSSTITYSDSGFSPSPLTVKSGSTVTITNSSGNALQFDSDPHPDHTDNTQLNVGLVSPGQSKTFKVTTTGTWGYHNHLSSTNKGTLIVQ